MVVVLRWGSTSPLIVETNQMIELKQVDNPYEKQENWAKIHVDTFLSSDLVVLPLTKNE
jgi:hypothetical protein